MSWQPRANFPASAAAVAPLAVLLLGAVCTAAAARGVAAAAGPAAAVAAGGGAVTLLLAGLAGLQAHARAEADAARRRAEAARDAAEAARAEAEAARDLAERAGRVKDEFLATLSHELRTPLNAVLGWAQLLLRGGGGGGGVGPALPPEVDEGLAVIERNAKAQARIVDDLLDVSRMVAGRLRLDVRPVDLAATAAAAAESARPSADAKGVALEVLVVSGPAPAAGGAVVRGDPERLQQVAWNLVANAVKFTPAGGRVRIAVTSSSSSSSSSGGRVSLSVADTGEGIDPAFLPRAFDRFAQADGSTTRRHGGLGLGLAIVRHLVELHGGTVRAESRGPGAGSTFTIELPAAAAAAPAAVGAATAAGDGAGATAAAAVLGGLTVLAVDDDPDARELARRVLGGAGATVLLAAGAAEALALVRARRPDVLVGDVGLPETDGLAMVRAVRAMGALAGGATPAVALTAFAADADRARALAAGFDEHLAKPADAADLIAAVARLAAGRPRAGPPAAAGAAEEPGTGLAGMGQTRRQRLGLPDGGGAV